MKAISLWEPWASLIKTGAKTFETRSWETSYRGELLICASKGGLNKSELLSYLSMWEFQAGLAPLKGEKLNLDKGSYKWAGVGLNDLNYGMAVAIVELVDCIPTEKITLSDIWTDAPYGDYSLGRFAWKLKMIDNKILFPVSGHQGLFNVDLDARINKNGN